MISFESAIIKYGDTMKKILCALLLMVSLTGCSQKALSKHTATATNIGFDTAITFTAYTESEEEFNTFNEVLQNDFIYYNKLFDKYNDYEDVNNVKTINDNAGIQPVVVDEELMELLVLSKTYDTLTNHQFDITMGAVLNIWHDYREAGELANQENRESALPSLAELKKADAFSGWNHVQLDEEKNTVYIDNKSTSLDVGGVAKGFAVEKIAKELETKGLQHAIINAGGNVRLIGNKPENDSWSVGIQIPDMEEMQTDSLFSVKYGQSASFVTSGDYQRFYLHDGQLIHHIIDPTTLQPARYCRSVTVIAKDSGIADILSTSLYNMSYADGSAFLKRLKDEEGIEVNAIWVYDDVIKPDENTKVMDVKGYQVAVSEGLQDNIKLK